MLYLLPISFLIDRPFPHPDCRPSRLSALREDALRQSLRSHSNAGAVLCLVRPSSPPIRRERLKFGRQRGKDWREFSEEETLRERKPIRFSTQYFSCRLYLKIFRCHFYRRDWL